MTTNRTSKLVAGVVAAAMTAAAVPAFADTQACMSASEKGQRSRSAGKLREARDQFLVCGDASCPAIIRRDCAQWQSEVVAILPSVVFGARDKDGRDLIDVTVSMDGEVLVKKLDGKSVTVDPGPHLFKFEAAGFPAVSERALVKEGEKTRVINATFAESGGSVQMTNGQEKPASSSTVEPPQRSPGPDKGGEGGHTIAPWIVVGVGAATALVGIGIFLSAPDRPANCDKDTQRCTRGPTESAEDFANDQDTAGKADTLPTAGLITFVIGLVVAGGGVAWHFLEPTDKTAGLHVSPWTTRSAGGLSLGASF